ncbi:MAG: hypothetical protein ACI9IP_002887 [Arcticibacterium sp.]|jgi:hypothetical protein
MVNSKDIGLLIHLAEQPEKATPMDRHWLNELIKTYPNFDFLLKVYVSVSHQIGILTEDSNKMKALWNIKKKFFEIESKLLEAKELSEIDKCTASQRIRLFLANFEPKYRPFTLSGLE